jgi:hypothetical protein
MKKIIYILLTLSVFQSSCETDADIPIPQQDPKLVLSAFLQPGAERQFAKLYMSDPIFDGSNIDFTSMINNADVFISDGVKTVKFAYDFNVDSYVILSDSFNINYNTEYTITAKYEGKEVNSIVKTISATPIQIVEVKFDSLIEETPFGYSTKTYFGFAKWVDPPQEKNYYCIEMYALVKNITGDTSRISLSDFYSSLYLSDEGKNGNSMTAIIEAYQYNPEIVTNGYIGYELLISKTDEAYFRYFKSLQNYGGDDPFSEPSLIYSNVNNGLGIVASFAPFSFKKGL